MKQLRSIMVPAVIVLAPLFWIGCQFSTAKVAEVALARKVNENKEPVDRTTIFSIEDYKIHCAVHVTNAPSETKLRAVWYHLNEQTKEKKEMTFSDYTMNEDAWIDFFITPSTAAFPPGEYVVEILLNDKMSNAVNFKVRAPEPSPLIEAAALASTATPSGELTVMETFPLQVDKIYAQVKVKETTPGLKLTAEWYEYDITTGEKKPLVSTDFVPTQPQLIDFTLSPKGTLKEGRYFVNILVNGTLSHSLFFTMK